MMYLGPINPHTMGELRESQLEIEGYTDYGIDLIRGIEKITQYAPPHNLRELDPPQEDFFSKYQEREERRRIEQQEERYQREEEQRRISEEIREMRYQEAETRRIEREERYQREEEREEERRRHQELFEGFKVPELKKLESIFGRERETIYELIKLEEPEEFSYFKKKY